MTYDISPGHPKIRDPWAPPGKEKPQLYLLRMEKTLAGKQTQANAGMHTHRFLRQLTITVGNLRRVKVNCLILLTS